MLIRLQIENLALIERAELEPSAGLNVLTGETGAGKTILAQAIGLLAGAQPAPGLVGPHGDEAYVEAEFEVPDGFLDDPRAGAGGGPAAGGRGHPGGRAAPVEGRVAAERWSGAAPVPGPTWRSSASGCWRCRPSTRPGGWPARPTSSSCSTRLPGTTTWCGRWPRPGPLSAPRAMPSARRVTTRGKRRCDATSWRSWYAGWTRWKVRAPTPRRWRRSVRCCGTSRS